MQTAMAATLHAMVSRIERVFKMLNLPMGEKHLFGEKLSVSDLQVFFRLQTTFEHLSRVQCLQFKIFMSDPAYNKHVDMKSVLDDAPTVLKFANNAEKHPIVAEYLAADGNLPYTGLNILE